MGKGHISFFTSSQDNVKLSVLHETPENELEESTKLREINGEGPKDFISIIHRGTYLRCCVPL